MPSRDTAEKIRAKIKKAQENYTLYEDMHDYLENLCAFGSDRDVHEDFRFAHSLNHDITEMAMEQLRYAKEREARARFYEIYRKLLRYDAESYFDSYLKYIELDRPADKRFYAPRRHYLLPIINGYQMLLDNEIEFLSISIPKRSGKAVTLDTPIPTPSGMKTMRDIHVGDLVIGQDGKATTVTDVFPQGKVPVYEVRFSDGAIVKTCANHLWKVKYHDVNASKGNPQYIEKILTTGEMLECGVKSKGKNAHNIFAVQYTCPVEFNKQDLPLHPYLLGVILGDGSIRQGTISITIVDDEIYNKIKRMIPNEDEIYCQDRKKKRYLIKSLFSPRNPKGYHEKSQTRKILDSLGYSNEYSWEKHVPEQYLYSDVNDRTALLAGLLDTDGYANKNGKHIEFSTTSPALRDSVMFLVRSLGGKARYTSRMGAYKKGNVKIETRENYRVNIEFPEGFNPLSLERKAARYNPKRKNMYHYIEEIVPCGCEEAQCICVDNKDHMFLVGDCFVPTHNSQCGINFTCMLSGIRPDNATLMEGAGDDLVKSFYKGCLEYVSDDSEYLFKDVFPHAFLCETNADVKTLNLHKQTRFPTIMCRSIDARQVGLSEATNLLYLDDTVEGRKEAKNRLRLDEKWEIISGDIIGRAIEGTPIVSCGTRYSLYDPMGRLIEEMRKQGRKMKVLEIPALDPVTDTSNFEYIRQGKRVFTTQYFRNQRDMLTEEQFESEFQQQPFEAKGLLFPRKSLNRFFELPVDRDPDVIMCVCDTSEKGEDFCSMPVAMIYGEDVYIVDVVYDDSTAEVTKPECVQAIIRNSVSVGIFESNGAGEYFARDVSTELSSRNYTCNIKLKRTITNKQTRIEYASPNILKNFYFLDESKYEPYSQYGQFMKNLTTYTRSGKVPHDDAPDSLSLLENEIRNLSSGKVEVFQRPV